MWLNIFCTTVELSGLLLVLAVGAPYLGSVSYLDASTASNPTGLLSLPLVFSGAVLTFYSFIGFEDIINVSEEVKNPEFAIPWGIVLAVTLSSAVYIGISLVAVSVIPAVELGRSTAPLVEVVAKAAPWFPPVGFTVIALFAVANTALLNFIMGSRLVYGMANDGLLPKVLSRVSSRRRTPHYASFAILALLLLLAVSGDIASLARATSVLLLICFVSMNLSLVVLKARKTEKKGKFEVPYWIPVLGALVSAGMLCAAGWQELRVAGSMLAAIALLYFIVRPGNPS
jgi:amino acid transporter